MRPRGQGGTHVIWAGGGPERELQLPRAVPGGVYQENRPKFARM